MNFTEADTSKTADIGDLRIHYHDCDQGHSDIPVLLIHGGGPGATGWSNYARNVDELAKDRRVIVVDLPGYGKSGLNTAEDNVLGHYAEIMSDFLDKIELKRVHIVGNSLGGGTALQIALKFPKKVASLVLMGSGGSLPIFTPMPTEGIKKLFAFYQGAGPSLEKLREFIECLVFDPSIVSEEMLLERYEAATTPHILANPPLKFRGRPPLEDLWREPLQELPHETLIISGREDRVVPLDASFILLKLIPNSRLHVFPKCGHWAQIEKADEFNGLVSGFMRRAERAGK